MYTECNKLNADLVEQLGEKASSLIHGGMNCAEEYGCLYGEYGYTVIQLLNHYTNTVLVVYYIKYDMLMVKITLCTTGNHSISYSI